MIDKLKLIEGELSAKEMPEFNIGDTVKVLTKIPEGDKVRLHPFESGDCQKRLRRQNYFYRAQGVFWRRDRGFSRFILRPLTVSS